MIKQGMVNDSLLYKKFKILRTSILLGNINNREDVFNDFADTARELDRMQNNVYEEKLASRMYTTVTLEEEQAKLKDLISCIQDRVRERNDYLDDYMKITSSYLDDLSPISLVDDLDTYKLRLSNIDEYLSNCSEINEINEKLVKLRADLESKYNAKENNELIDSKLEDELIVEFNKYISSNQYYASLNYSDIDGELDKLNDEIKEKETVMNTFISSYEALVNAGITGAEREEYSSYVRDARDDYYDSLEKKFILDIYKLVLDKESDYTSLYEKREKLNVILYERDTIRKKLSITKRDEIEYFIKVCEEQFNIIKSQKYILDDIDSLILEIGNLEDRLVSLETANNRKEIVEIVESFQHIELEAEDSSMFEDESKEENEEINLEDDEFGLKEEIREENNVSNLSKVSLESQEVIKNPSNMVVRIKDPVKINVKKATDTAKLVMKKVVIVLEPKKFNVKRDKLKEAEEELKSREEIVTKENPVITSESLVNVNLDTVAVNDKKDIKEINEVSEIKINAPDSGDINIPTEIFIDEPPKEEVPLFTMTDPFLDDNYLVSPSKNNDTANNMPKVFNIGTVKPNSALAKIEDTVNENDNVILPTMGLSNVENENVPIVSENYIN